LAGEWFNLCPVDAAIGACVLARDLFLEVCKDDEGKVYKALTNLGISAEIARCFDFIKECKDKNVPLQTKLSDENGSKRQGEPLH
jgi:hypothetical protein